MKGAAEFHSGRLGPCVCSFVVSCYSNRANKNNHHILWYTNWYRPTILRVHYSKVRVRAKVSISRVRFRVRVRDSRVIFRISRVRIRFRVSGSSE